MAHIAFHKDGAIHTGEVADNTNLVVRAAIREFPFPYLRFGCGMGKCGKCACRILQGSENLPPPNWKETKRLEARIEDGFRLVCQLWLHHDLTLAQDEVV
jgi:ferredoxin